LHHAAQSGDVPMIDFLIHHGAVVNSTNQYSYTPLYLAAGGGQTLAVKKLVEHGADSFIADKVLITGT
jgi:ankyrin repeat protein